MLNTFISILDDKGKQRIQTKNINYRVLIKIFARLIDNLQQFEMYIPGADPGFQVRGAHLEKLRLAEGGAKLFWVFRVKNHDFTPKNHIFPNFRGGARRVRPPPWIRPCIRIEN
jgi:hypothetical protein